MYYRISRGLLLEKYCSENSLWLMCVMWKKGCDDGFDINLAQTSIAISYKNAQNNVTTFWQTVHVETKVSSLRGRLLVSQNAFPPFLFYIKRNDLAPNSEVGPSAVSVAGLGVCTWCISEAFTGARELHASPVNITMRNWAQNWARNRLCVL